MLSTPASPPTTSRVPRWNRSGPGSPAQASPRSRPMHIPRPKSLLAQERAAIDECFAPDTVPAILARLEARGDAWAKAVLETLARMSPTSLCVTAELLRRGASMTLAECLEMELKLTRKVIVHPDFAEGVRAQVVDKTRDPKWRPATVAEVDPAAIRAMFD
ncbi:MAG: enoyl-CoA hydratase/isomerase family protein [Acetobacteraceae bacterium]|nr:enoyl-CoA hydratase/isomerase family protein [Acetobacteraceae bacterium]